MTRSINYCSSLLLPFLSNIHWQRILSVHIVFSFYDEAFRMDRYKILLILALVLAVIATSLAFLTIFNLCDDDKCGGTWYDKESLNDRKIGAKIRLQAAFHFVALIHGTITIIFCGIPLCTKMGENRVVSFLLTPPMTVKMLRGIFCRQKS